MTEITPELAQQELINRQRARVSLIDFISYTYPGYVVANFNTYVCAALEQLESRQITRLIMTAPPRAGKSEIASIRFPAWYLGKHPTHNIILASYGADLAGAKAKECRDVIETAEYKRVFPMVSTRDDSRAGEHWKITYMNSASRDWRNGGEFFSTGVGGPATGFGADLLIIDDYLKNWKDAQSPTIKQDQWDWFKSTIFTRLAPNAIMLVLATRWAKDDLIGKILEESPEQWAVIRAPAISENSKDRDFKNAQYKLPAGLPDFLGRPPNTALMPERYDLNYLLNVRATQGVTMFETMYQGYPAEQEGNRFKREYFKNKIDRNTLQDSTGRYITRDIVRIRYWDKAATQDGGCYTAGVLMAYNRNTRKFIIEDVQRVQFSTTIREELIRRIADQDGIDYDDSVETWVEQEPGSGGKDSASITISNLAGHRAFADKVTGSKDTRLEQFLAQLEGGNVQLVEARWNSDFVDEFVAIPFGLFRDQSDATAGAFNKLMAKRKSSTATSAPIVTNPFSRR